MSKRRILLGISTSRYSMHLLEHALDEARRFHADGDDVVIDVVYVIEGEDLSHVSEMIGDQGFLGLSPQSDVITALCEEHNRMALRRVQEVMTEAGKHQIEVQVSQVQGRFVDEIVSHANKLSSDIILITRAERPFISRILFGSECDQVARLARQDNLGRVIIDDE